MMTTNNDNQLILHIEPVAKPRMTQQDKWLTPPRPAVAKYWRFVNTLKELLGDFELPAVFDVVFFVPTPDSWSRKKKRKYDGRPHQQTPDRDNLLKALQDSLCDNDKYIYDGRVAKFWTNGPGRIELTLYD